MPENERERLSPQSHRTLLEVARRSIRQGLKHGVPLNVVPSEFSSELQLRRASFVTLQAQGALRGCIGHLEAFQTLVEDVAENAFAAAFRDPRFPPLSEEEYQGLEIHISVLTPARTMAFDSEADLVSKLRPGIDGLILQDGHLRGTFLPSVWESLPDPQQFLNHLKVKAGLPAGYWSDSVRVSRYETESFG